jgi:hypothetical protein
MSVLDFPSSPSVGDTYLDWVWDGTKWIGTAPIGEPGFTFTANSFTVPQVGAAVSVSVEATTWAAEGMVVFISGMYASIQSIGEGVFNLLRISSASAGTDNIVNTVVPAGTLVTAGGWPGIPGPPGPALPAVSIQPSVDTATDLPTTGNRNGDGRITEDTNDLWIWDGTQWYNSGPITGGPPGPPGPVFTPETTGSGVIFVLQTAATLMQPTTLAATLGGGTTVLAGMNLAGGLTTDNITNSGQITSTGAINTTSNFVSVGGNFVCSNNTGIPSFTLLGPSSSFFAMGATAGLLIFGQGSSVTGGLVTSASSMDQNGNWVMSGRANIGGGPAVSANQTTLYVSTPELVLPLSVNNLSGTIAWNMAFVAGALTAIGPGIGASLTASGASAASPNQINLYLTPPASGAGSNFLTGWNWAFQQNGLMVLPGGIQLPLNNGTNVGDLAYNAAWNSTNGWTYATAGSAYAVVPQPAAAGFQIYAAPVGAAGAAITWGNAQLSVQTNVVALNAPLNMVGNIITGSGGTQFNVYSNNYTWAFNFGNYGGAAGNSIVARADTTEMILVWGFNQTPSWFPWSNVATAGGGDTAQANISYAGPNAYVSWPTNFSSSRKIKKNITAAYKSGLDVVKALAIYSADWREPGATSDWPEKHHDWCFIADEVEQIAAQAVCKSPNPDGIDILNPLHLVSVLWKAVQELTAKVETLEGAKT